MSENQVLPVLTLSWLSREGGAHFSGLVQADDRTGFFIPWERVRPMNDYAAKNDLERQIRERAYRIWVTEGKPTGKSDDHLLRAKQEIEQEGAIKAGPKT